MPWGKFELVLRSRGTRPAKFGDPTVRIAAHRTLAQGNVEAVTLLHFTQALNWPRPLANFCGVLATLEGLMYFDWFLCRCIPQPETSVYCFYL